MKKLLIIIIISLFTLNAYSKSKERISSSDIIPIIEKADKQFENEEYDWALRYYTEALEEDSSNPKVQLGLGATYFALQDYSLAIEHFKQALELNPALIEAYYGLSCVYQATGKVDLAFKYYRKALGLDSHGQISAINKVILSKGSL